MHKGNTDNEVDPAKSAPQYQAFSIVRLYSSVLGAALLNLGLRNQVRYKNPRARIYLVPNRHIGIGDNDLYHRFSIFNIRSRVHGVCNWLRLSLESHCPVSASSYGTCRFGRLCRHILYLYNARRRSHPPTHKHSYSVACRAISTDDDENTLCPHETHV